MGKDVENNVRTIETKTTNGDVRVHVSDMVEFSFFVVLTGNTTISLSCKWRFSP